MPRLVQFGKLVTLAVFVVQQIIGFVIISDETELPNSWDVIDMSYGIGVSKSSYDVEYMLSMDEEGDGVSAVGLGINSRF